MAAGTLALALMLAVGGELTQSHHAPAKAEPHADAKTPAPAAPAATPAPEQKKAAPSPAAAAPTTKPVRPTIRRIASRPRIARPAPPRPSTPRLQLRWPSFEERWHIAWPAPQERVVALVWPTDSQ